MLVLGYNDFMSTVNADEFIFDKGNSILLVGQTGSGKSYLAHVFIDKLKRAYSVDEIKFALFDLKRAEFDKNEIGEEYLLFDIQIGDEHSFEKLDELASLAKQRASEKTKSPLIFVYIEECDMACADQERFDNALILINNYAGDAGMKLIYSTSSPRTDTISKKLMDSFDQILVGALPDGQYEYLNIKPQSIQEFEFIEVNQVGSKLDEDDIKKLVQYFDILIEMDKEDKNKRRS